MSPVTVLAQSLSEPPTLRVVGGGAKEAGAGRAGQSAGASGADSSRDVQFREIYERWFDDVVGWLYALGAPAADTEDLAQEIFIVVRRNLGRFDGGNLAGWLYRIAQLTVRDHRRRSWFRNLVLRRQEVDLSKMPHDADSPARSFEDAEARRQFQLMVTKMHGKLVTTFILFEIEGYSGEEIARIQDIPIGTVWTRLHKARKEFWKLVKEQRDADEAIR
ncbi:MAG TPA: sigma-70 family RNA polymerase sigma factor [Polyangia bacterium]|jgi:RNA polymerase sigma-70 factor (ECF subfamily)|nr:sigma-70 family RNA polymerase sigma factor [Polyangia bacterium]